MSAGRVTPKINMLGVTLHRTHLRVSYRTMKCLIIYLGKAGVSSKVPYNTSTDDPIIGHIGHIGHTGYIVRSQACR